MNYFLLEKLQWILSFITYLFQFIEAILLVTLNQEASFNSIWTEKSHSGT